MDYLKAYKKWVMPLLALLIFIMLGTLVFLLSNEQSLKKEISENCGWETEAYKCYCQKSDVNNIEFVINGSLNDPNLNINYDPNTTLITIE